MTPDAVDPAPAVRVHRDGAFLFVPLSLGLAVLLAIMESVFVMTGKAVYRRMTQFWARPFAISFALGVATGLPLEYLPVRHALGGLRASAATCSGCPLAFRGPDGLPAGIDLHRPVLHSAGGSGGCSCLGVTLAARDRREPVGVLDLIANAGCSTRSVRG